MVATIAINASLVLSMLAVFVAIPVRKPVPIRIDVGNGARFGDSASRAPGIR
jgi:hypothetical protein